MRVVKLSDHPGDLLRQSRKRGGKEQQRAMSQFRAAERKHQAELGRLTEERDQARARRRWLAWFLAALAVRRARRKAPVPPVQPAVLSDDEARLAAGIAGEQFLAEQLGKVLNGEWVLFRGYYNQRGEIDHLLLGPLGLVAIEVKYVNGTFHCEGNRWRVVKFDNYGNQVEDYELTDKRGRSPSVQLNEPADLLEQFLHSRGEDVSVLRVVQLTHPKAQVGTLRRATVNIFTKTSQLTTLMKKVPQPLDPASRSRLEDLIVRDHKHHASRRPH
jgi:Nuclease-related domain